MVQAILNHIGTKTIQHIAQAPLIISDDAYEAPIFFGFDFINGTPLLGTGTTQVPFLICSSSLYFIQRYQNLKQSYPGYELMQHADQTYSTVECGINYI